MIDPLLKWAGAKRWQVPMLRPYYRGQRIVELFCGSAAITFGLQPERALLNDLNPHLINFYHQVQRGLTVDIDLSRSESLYYAHRDWFNGLILTGQERSAEAAQLFYYLNHHGYNGLCRFNRAGAFNVPPRPGVRPAFAPFDASAYMQHLSRWVFRHGDWADVILQSDDLVYADPPYDEVFTDYTGHTWTREHAEDLALRLIGHTGPVVMMNSNTDWVRETYAKLGYHITLLKSSQRMQNSRGRNDDVLEAMATNFPIDKAVAVVDDAESLP